MILKDCAFLWGQICDNLHITKNAEYFHNIISSFKIISVKDYTINIFTNYSDINSLLDDETISSLENSIRTVFNDNDICINYCSTYNKEFPLNINKTLDNFILNPENRLAIAVAKDICSENPNNTYSPLFLYAGAGLGKTHLINAIILKYSSIFPDKKINYYSGEEFITSFFEATKNNNLQKWREYNCECSLFIIDDIHSLENNENVINEFASLFDVLYSATNKPHFIITSNKAPNDLVLFNDSLKSKLQWGVNINILSPNKSTKENIINSIFNKFNIQTKSYINEYIAKNYSGNIRGLEGFVKTIYTHSTLLNEDINIELIDKILGKKKTTQQHSITGSDILYNVCNYFNISEIEIKSKNRTRAIAFPRQVGMYITKKLTNASLQDIGKLYGGRDHSTVKHSNDKIKTLYKNDDNIKSIIDNIIKLVNNTKVNY